MKKVCLDFDGVIFPNLQYKRSGVIRGDPVEGALDACKELSQKYEVIVHSARCSERDQREAIKAWLDGYGFFPFVQCVQHKPHAFVYIDDRGVCFRGDWKSTLEEIENFKQWQSDEKGKNRILRKRLRRR